MASDDMRENILARIFTVMASVTVDPAIVTTVRNRGLMENEKRPAQVLLDGDEFPRLSVDTRRIKGMASLMAPQIVQIRPGVYYLPKEKRPTNVQNGVNIGTEANTWRIAFLNKLWADVELAELLGSNGSMVYNGCETDLKSGSAMSGEIKLDFIVNYVLRPTA
jgi:hypothetical protein